MENDVTALLHDAEVTALKALQDDGNSNVHVMQDAILLVIDVLGQMDGKEQEQEALKVLRKILLPALPSLHDARDRGKTATPPSRAHPVLRALLTTLTVLASKSDVNMESIHGVVALVHEICLTSMTSADVVLLFEFLRVAKPPARRLILQMQRALVENESIPRAVFTLRGSHTGIIAPSTQMLFSKKGYTISFGLLLEAKATIVSLYSFRGNNGQGISAILEGSSLVIKTHGAQGSTSQVVVPFAEVRAKMEKGWVHLCIVHAKKMVFKDKISVHVDGVGTFNGNLPYPDPLCMVGGQNSIGIIPSVAGFEGQIWSPTLFGQPLNEVEIQKLHWLTHWKNDLSSVAAENAGLSDKSKFIFSYDARSVDPESRVCYDVSGNDCHGWMEPSTKAFVTQGFRDALDSIGGCACFLLLLLDQIPEMADFHPKHELSMEEIAELLSFVGAGLQNSIACRSHFVRLRAIKVLAFILQSVSPQYLTLDVVRSVTTSLSALLNGASAEQTTEYIHLLLFQNTSWFLSPFETQLTLLGEILPLYLQILQDIRAKERRRMQGGSAAGTVGGALGLAGNCPSAESLLEPSYQMDVQFFCNLLVQVYSRRSATIESEGSVSPPSPGRMDSKQLGLLRKRIIENLMDRLLFPLPPDDDLQQWRQLFAHLHHRCAALNVEAYDRDGDGVDVKEIVQYLTRQLTSGTDTSHSVVRQQMTAKICKLAKGTLRLWWRLMRVPIPEIRLEALRLFEAYCVDKVVLKRKDFLMLLVAHQASPMSMQTADLLLDLVIGRKHVTHYSSNGTSVSGNAAGHGGAGRSVNVGRLEFLPSVLLSLLSDADAVVQAHVLYEVRMLVGSTSVGETTKEAIRSWPPWLSRLRAIVRRASCQSVAADSQSDQGMSAQALNEACAYLSDDHVPVSTKLDAIHAISTARDERGCDFLLQLFQNADQPASVTKAIAATVREHFPSRCGTLVSRIANQLIVDITIYSVLHVRNGWIHFLEFYFAHWQSPSELCSLTAAIVEKIVRRLTASGTKPMMTTTPPVPAECVEFMWENLSQVASIVSLFPFVAEETRRSRGGESSGVSFSPGQEQIIARKAFELWLVLLPRLHLINWEQMKAQLLLNANGFGHDASAQEKEIFCYVVAGAAHARFLALQVSLRHVQFAQNANENHAGLVGNLKRVLETLRVIPSSQSALPAQSTGATSSSAASPVSASAASVARAFALYTADASAFVGELRLREAEVDKEFIHLYVLDALYTLLIHELRDGTCFKTTFALVEMLVALAAAALRLQGAVESEMKPHDVTKTLQIMASTDLAFFHQREQLAELVTLWRLHRDTHQAFCDIGHVRREIEHQNAHFVRRWQYVVEEHGVEFNPYLIQKDAAIQAELLGQELSASDAVWQELLDETAATAAAELETHDEEEGRLSSLKQDAEKFASSVHKLILHTAHEDQRGESSGDSGSDQVQHQENVKSDTTGGSDGFLWKVNSKENAFRMRLRLKKVRENYRLRNLSCEFGAAESSFHDDESRGGRIGPRRFRSARENIGGAGLAEFERTWRSDAGSDYSDFLADAHMRAAIIRSCSVGDRDSFAAGDVSDEDDVDDIEDAPDFDAEDEFENEARELVGDSNVTSANDVPMPAENESVRKSQTPDQPPVSPEREQMIQKAAGPTSPLGSFSGFGASVLSVVGGVADRVQKAAKDAKDAVDYGVDTLYTTRDAISDEAQSLVQEVATLIDTSKTPPPTVQGSTKSQAECRRLSVAINETPPSTTSDASQTNSVLFPPSPPRAGDEHRKSSGSGVSKEQSKLTRRGSDSGAMSKRELQFDANLVRHMNVVGGKLILTESHVVFVAERVVDEHETVLAERKKGVPIEAAWRFLFKRRRWKIDDIASINRRRYLLKPTAIELFIHSTRKSFFFSLSIDDIARFHEALMSRRPLLLRQDPTMRRLRHPSSIFRNSTMSVRWANHEISTFEYLMWLNTIAGRTYNDLTQYPVFPWVIADYESNELDLSRASTFRDLSKPMGALDPTRLRFFQERYQAFEDSDIPKFMYGTHYSNIGVVLYYLIRLEPFTSYALSVQGGRFDHADRLFHSVAETWKNCLHDFNDVKELTPEWFYLPEFFKNCNNLDLGVKQNGVVLGDVQLPPWAKSPEDFVINNLLALESEYVSAHIHKWIDLVFGSNQRGPAAIAANNVFFYLTYEGMVDIDSITDPVVKSSMRAQIAHFGQTPTQVLRDPHPPRLPQTLAHGTAVERQALAAEDDQPPQDRAVRPSSALSTARSTILALPHEHPIVMVHLVPGSSSMICVDTHGQVSMHRYGAKSVKVHHTPFLNDLSSTATKASGVFKAPNPAASAGGGAILGPNELSYDPAAEFIELHDRKCRKVISEKAVSGRPSVANTMAFLNAGAVYCTVGHHDFSARFHSANDGALLYRLLQHNSIVSCLGTSLNGSLLALGSMDGSISVWKVASIASTLLDSIKIFRNSKSSARPVQANDYSADQVLLGHVGSINCVAVSEDLGVCISGSATNECLAHDLEDSCILRQFDVPGSAAPGVVSVAISHVGHVVVQSMGSGVPTLYSFHLNGTFLAKVDLGPRPMTAISICTRYSKVIVSNPDHALVMSAHTLNDQQVLLDKSTCGGEIACQVLSPGETHVVFGIGTAKVVSLALLPGT